MLGYIVNFTVYTLAMMGIIFVGFVIAKRSLSTVHHKVENRFLSIESSLNLEPRKNLYVIKAGTERILVSTDAEKTQFLTKLEAGNIPQVETKETANQQQGVDILIPIISNFTKNFRKNLYDGTYTSKIIEKFKHVACNKS
jgi:flagellar biogenesis protein FliO